MKDHRHFLTHGHSLESPLQNQLGYLTPVERFFVCNSGTTPTIRAQDYALRIWGDGVARELVLNYGDVLKLPQRRVPALLECAGNHRSFFRDVQGETLEKRPGTTELIWSTGAVGMAEWKGVSLGEVLQLAGLRGNALQVCASGSETDSCEGIIRIPLGIIKALDLDTLLAVEMNGEPLHPDHGFPVRMLVPGWIGAYSIKWVQDIEVRTAPLWVKRNTESYVLQGASWPAARFSPALGQPITQLNIKSSLALPWPASLGRGAHFIHGYARSAGSPIKAVHWSDNKGNTWQLANMGEQNEPYGWTRFDFDWFAESGERVLMTRATDQSGSVQPESIPFNAGGYLYNAIHPHPVNVY